MKMINLELGDSRTKTTQKRTTKHPEAFVSIKTFEDIAGLMLWAKYRQSVCEPLPYTRQCWPQELWWKQHRQLA